MTEKCGKHMARGLANMVDGVEHPNQAPTTFVELSKRHEVFNLSSWEQYFFKFIVLLFDKNS